MPRILPTAICPVCGVDALESDLLDIGERSLAGYVMANTFSCLVCAWTGPVPEAEKY